MSGDPGLPIRYDATMRDAILPLFRTAKKAAWRGLPPGRGRLRSRRAAFPRQPRVPQEARAGGPDRLSGQQRQDIVETLEFLFGTPDEPRVPRLADMDVGQVCSSTRCARQPGPSAAIRTAANSACIVSTALTAMACRATVPARPPCSSNLIRATSAAGCSSTSRRRDRWPRPPTRIWSARSATAVPAARCRRLTC